MVGTLWAVSKYESNRRGRKKLERRKFKTFKFQWFTLVIPALWEEEVRGSLETRESTLQLAMITPLPCSMSNRARLCLFKKERKNIYEGSFGPTEFKFCGIAILCYYAHTCLIYIKWRKITERP